MFAVFRPAFGYPHKQEQMHPLAHHGFHIQPRSFTNGFQCLSALADHDTLMAIPRHMDHLMNLDGPVLAAFPFFRLDGDAIRQFLMKP